MSSRGQDSWLDYRTRALNSKSSAPNFFTNYCSGSLLRLDRRQDVQQSVAKRIVLEKARAFAKAGGLVGDEVLRSVLKYRGALRDKEEPPPLDPVRDGPADEREREERGGPEDSVEPEKEGRVRELIDEP